MEELFAQVLMLCARLGMGQLGVVAIDSVKIASNASLAANRTEDGLGKAAAEQAEIDAQRARELAAAAAAEHAATDAAEDALYGPGRRGDEVPAELVDERSRAARIAQALEELKADTAVRAAERDGACHSICVSPGWSIIGPPFGRTEGVFCDQDHAVAG